MSWGASYGSRSYCRACYDFTRTYPAGECGCCARVIAVKKGHCRLCWLQAGMTAAGRRITPADFTPAGYWQLSLAGMSRLGGTGIVPVPRPSAVPAAAAPCWIQLQLAPPGESLHFDKRHWTASAITGTALEQARDIAAGLAAARGWNDRIIAETARALAVVLAGHQPGDMIGWSQLRPALRRRDLSITRTAEILTLAGLLDDDRTASFTALAAGRLAPLPPPVAADVAHWLHTRSHGGPRSRARHDDTVRMNLNRVLPLLLEWAAARHYTHLREVTAADITTAVRPLTGHLRRNTLTALRSLFGHAKKHGTIFADPTRGIRDGQRALSILQPLQPADIDQAAAAAVTPAARLALALAAVHAARPKTIRELRLHDAGPGSGRLTVAGSGRPLDDLTRSLLLTWLEYRSQRWPGTGNPHLIINQQTAMTTRPVSENWLASVFRGLTATLERLHADRQLEEALTHGPDPLHLAAVFGIADGTAIRYAAIARQLLTAPAEQPRPAGSREPGDPDRP
jgi:hypothetical protein